MAEKKAIVVFAPDLDFSAPSEAMNTLKKRAAFLPNSDTAGLETLTEKMGAVKAEGNLESIQALFDKDNAFICVNNLAAALEAADRRTVLAVMAKSGVAFYGLAINPKVGKVERPVNSQDIAVTLASIADLPIDETCTGAIVYQILKNPNFKLDEIKKLRESITRMESVIARENREPWEKHDCA